jgi:hypothetical protein
VDDTQNITNMVLWGASAGLGAGLLVFIFSYAIGQVKNLINIISN